MLKRMNVVAQIGILSFYLLIGLDTWAQEKSSVVVKILKRRLTNQAESGLPSG